MGSTQRPQRFSSLRYGRHPPVLKPFRDDTLVAFRYESTVQAAPPIPIPPPRNPLRANQPSSSVSRAVVVNPPQPPPIPPVLEQHPAFRNSPASSTTSSSTSPTSAASINTTSCTRTSTNITQEERSKRDSGLAPTTSSCTTLRGEFEEDPVWKKVEEEEPVVVASVAPPRTRCIVETTILCNEPPTPPSIRFSLFSSSTSTPPTTATGDHSHPPLTERRGLGKSFSLRSSASSRRLRKKSMDIPRVDQAGPMAATPDTAGSGGGVAAPRPNAGKSARSRKNSIGPIGSPNRLARALSGRTSISTSTVSSGASNTNPFSPITTTIPTDTLVDEEFLAQLSFSKRGSVMLGGKKAVTCTTGMIAALENADNKPSSPTKATAEAAVSAKSPSKSSASSSASSSEASSTPKSKPTNTLTATANTAMATASSTPAARESSSSKEPIPSIRVMSMDAEREANKVRALYMSGDTEHLHDGDAFSLDERLEASLPEAPGDQASETDPYGFPLLSRPVTLADFTPLRNPTPTPAATLQPDERPTSYSETLNSDTSYPCRPTSSLRSVHELAGGLEDWEDLEGDDVDRYGFIKLRRPATTGTAWTAPAPTTEMLSPNRASPAGRRRLVKRDITRSMSRGPSRKVSARSLHTQASGLSVSSRISTQSSVRTITNRLPHNRDRRLMDEASNMLDMSPGAPKSEEDEESLKLADNLKKKEWERAEKWGKMAKVVKKGKEGEGMEFEFDAANTKLIERTWKGIPDRWRASAWYSFLSTSAKARPGSLSESDIVAEFNRLQDVPSPDDVQIDLDVPRTISGHVMFRRRYHGGQRLLFRALHALSLYFPITGYVQGMASLAATLLCYYDEERCFVMLVRMWQLRGIDQIYQPGFEGLMDALEVFQKTWLADKDVAQKLTDLCIEPTAYATRWYLTLFNLSVPFPAQLRIWDVFMLLGDNPSVPPSSSSSKKEDKKSEKFKDKSDAHTPSNGIDILHAASAALIHALREVLLGSDFENAMKTLTSFVPIKDPDLLMKVTKAEYKQHHDKKI
ncbi:TBC domain-containing protein [Zalerion maritima]|uniref:TBC domain-containing protein n=1 Tax=Zalerion maritima TaxID=339359 RepID=A0AAD5RNM7_9PEZI|nr:TBC domain-containing protein [Zalerion maritima]